MPPSSPSQGAGSVIRHNPKTLWDATANGHSQISVVEGGKLAFLSGQIALRPEGGTAPDDLSEQAQIVADNLSSALTELAAQPKDVVALRMYLVNATKERFIEAFAPLKALLGDELPSVTALGLQALYTTDLQLEVEMIVRVP